MDLSVFLTDEKAEAEGRWVEFGDGAAMLLARINNEKAQALFEKLMAPYNRPGFRKRNPSKEQMRKVVCEVLAHGCIKDWRGFFFGEKARRIVESQVGFAVCGEDGYLLPYTPDLGIAVLGVSKDLTDQVFEAAKNEENFRIEQLEEDAGL